LLDVNILIALIDLMHVQGTPVVCEDLACKIGRHVP
jgi:hypothetical protein